MNFNDREVRLAYLREWYKQPGNKAKIIAANKRRRVSMVEAVRAIKMELGCKRCGYRDCAEALEFHHRTGGTKRFHISTAARNGIAWSRIEAEIAKCDVLCANCHRRIRCACCPKDDL